MAQNVSKENSSRWGKENGTDSKPGEHSRDPVGNAATSVQPIQPENAFETGGKGSLQRRVLGRNVEEIRGQGTAGPDNLDIPAGQHATGSSTDATASSTHATGSPTHATASFTEVTKGGKLEVHRTGGMGAVKNPKDKDSA